MYSKMVFPMSKKLFSGVLLLLFITLITLGVSSRPSLGEDDKIVVGAVKNGRIIPRMSEEKLRTIFPKKKTGKILSVTFEFIDKKYYLAGKVSKGSYFILLSHSSNGELALTRLMNSCLGNCSCWLGLNSNCKCGEGNEDCNFSELAIDVSLD